MNESLGGAPAVRRHIRVAVNLAYLRPTLGGMETYAYELLRAMSATGEVKLTALCTRDAVELNDIPDLEIHHIVEAPYSLRGRVLGETLRTFRYLHAARPDVMFSPLNYVPLLVPEGIPQVATIHDLQHLSFPEYFSRAVRVWRKARFTATFATCRRLIAISDFTREEIMRNFGVDGSRITCVHSGVTAVRERPLEPAVLARFDRADPLIYYPAMGTPHKNHAVLFRAMRMLLETGRRAPRLVLTGRGGEVVMREAAACGISSSVTHLGFVSREEVDGLTIASKALVYPSRYEGFGLPVLEAQLAGVPVIASDIPVLREVAGEAAQFVPVDDVRGWADAIEKVLSSETERAHLIRAGRRNVRRFSWDSCARATLAALRAALPSRQASD